MLFSSPDYHGKKPGPSSKLESPCYFDVQPGHPWAFGLEGGPGGLPAKRAETTKRSWGRKRVAATIIFASRTEMVQVAIEPCHNKQIKSLNSGSCRKAWAKGLYKRTLATLLLTSCKEFGQFAALSGGVARAAKNRPAL